MQRPFKIVALSTFFLLIIWKPLSSIFYAAYTYAMVFLNILLFFKLVQFSRKIIRTHKVRLLKKNRFQVRIFKLLTDTAKQLVTKTTSITSFSLQLKRVLKSIYHPYPIIIFAHKQKPNGLWCQMVNCSHTHCKTTHQPWTVIHIM